MPARIELTMLGGEGQFVYVDPTSDGHRQAQPCAGRQPGRYTGNGETFVFLSVASGRDPDLAAEVSK
jgi:hypothetical protein